MAYKQVILVRQDLQLPKGKLAAQAAHASVEAVLKSDQKTIKEWRSEGMAKIVLKVKEVQEDPFRFLEHYEGKDYYKLRVGDYRLLIDIDFKNKVLLVQVIGHRSNIYERGK